ncbi:hypothetical protein FA95DRAFT_1358329 [Auriscalpium vulgare]|uniref:Uncharacterized protein n=1 Tax=Auriscalpium vulgare TaxID=40419 RepID=A0ACB8RQI6_9AGAM|nr:hypothetical protein FA95DRAFT_1358329 [Auriscalpium vulgare]
MILQLPLSSHLSSQWTLTPWKAYTSVNGPRTVGFSMRVRHQVPGRPAQGGIRASSDRSERPAQEGARATDRHAQEGARATGRAAQGEGREPTGVAACGARCDACWPAGDGCGLGRDRWGRAPRAGGVRPQAASVGL